MVVVVNNTARVNRTGSIDYILWYWEGSTRSVIRLHYFCGHPKTQIQNHQKHIKNIKLLLKVHRDSFSSSQILYSFFVMSFSAMSSISLGGRSPEASAAKISSKCPKCDL